ncbi:MAG: hypothetical protein CML46_06750 [Rhodobacteraceae bacterium]|nr:hypothetical protein [Paracoccaceae bacterium]MBR26624.1 hypothetical protein [Paracoccaceae bacterium]
MELWIPITIAAAFCQNLRSALQKRLRATLSVEGATGARFVYAAPLALALLAALIWGRGDAIPVAPGRFHVYSAIGGLSQIGATWLLIHLFSMRNFAVATGLTKTETVQTALIGVVLLGDPMSLAGAAAILVSLVGVALISLPAGGVAQAGVSGKSALIGIASGGLFGLSAVAYRGAALSLESGDVILRAATTLAEVTLFQAVLVVAFLMWRDRAQARALAGAWRASSWVGLVGMLGSLGWFAAFTLQSAAHVRALGQVEVIFMVAASVIMFRERPTRREILGVCLVALGIVGLVIWGA